MPNSKSPRVHTPVNTPTCPFLPQGSVVIKGDTLTLFPTFIVLCFIKF
nr:MAG TPA: Kinase A inhibitor, histidine kinase inhibitor, ATP-binding.01A [Caudoviricetes sp.]DAW51507.1 MAG TPA: Kinase A inhibitor, histidine kinase inhibitor, ATP-binding.01A [Caudoviricetes sp.]